jgi:hypothetical protein
VTPEMTSSSQPKSALTNAGSNANETSVIPTEEVEVVVVEAVNEQNEEAVQSLDKEPVVDTSTQETPTKNNTEDHQSYPGLKSPITASPTQESVRFEQNLPNEPTKKSWASLAANGVDKWSSQLAETKGRVASVPPPQNKPLPQVREQRGGRQQEHRRNSDTSLSVYIRVASGLTYDQVKKAISTFGTLKYLDVVPTKGCAFAGFSTLEAYRAALNAREVNVGQGTIQIEERRKASGGSNTNTGGNRNQGSGTQGSNNRGNFTGNNRGGAPANQYNKYGENQNGNYRHGGNINIANGNSQNDKDGSPIGNNKSEKRKSSSGNRPRQSGKNQ